MDWISKTAISRSYPHSMTCKLKTYKQDKLTMEDRKAQMKVTQAPRATLRLPTSSTFA